MGGRKAILWLQRNHHEDKSLTLRIRQLEERSEFSNISNPSPKSLPLEFLRNVKKKCLTNHPSQFSIKYSPNVIYLTAIITILLRYSDTKVQGALPPGSMPHFSLSPLFPSQHAHSTLRDPTRIATRERCAAATHQGRKPWPHLQVPFFSDSPGSWQQSCLGSLLSGNIFRESKLLRLGSLVVSSIPKTYLVSQSPILIKVLSKNFS